jgi:hypothetical protein
MTEGQIERLIAALDRISDQLNMIDERLLDFTETLTELTDVPSRVQQGMRNLRVDTDPRI